MASFKKSNGKQGAELCFHTATGYECIANHPGNRKGFAERIHFYVRHVVGIDGFPYTEVGLTGLDEEEYLETFEWVRESLKSAGFQEVLDMTEYHDKDDVYAEQITHDPTSFAFRLNAGSVDIKKAINVFSSLMETASKQFVIEQEQVPDVLFHSILSEMGEELKKGPGGDEYASKKARELAETLEKGYWTA